MPKSYVERFFAEVNSELCSRYKLYAVARDDSTSEIVVFVGKNPTGGAWTQVEFDFFQAKEYSSHTDPFYDPPRVKYFSRTPLFVKINKSLLPADFLTEDDAHRMAIWRYGDKWIQQAMEGHSLPEDIIAIVAESKKAYEAGKEIIINILAQGYTSFDADFQHEVVAAFLPPARIDITRSLAQHKLLRISSGDDLYWDVKKNFRYYSSLESMGYIKLVKYAGEYEILVYPTLNEVLKFVK